MTQKTQKNETLKTLIFAVSLAVIFRSFFLEPFHIPSGSMKDTLLIGDFIFVNKGSYGYSRYSFPLGLPFFKGRILEKEKPQRGDIIVFRLPRNPSVDYIKRLIGLPGDKIQVKAGVLYINGEAASQQAMGDFVEKNDKGEVISMSQIFQETLPNGVVHHVLNDIDDGLADNTVEYTVPEGHYFFMGDNRDHSTDSRFTDQVGYVPEENLVGRAVVIVMSIKEDKTLLKFWEWGHAFRTDRFFTWLKPEHKAEK